MYISTTILRTALKQAGILALTMGLPLSANLNAQSSSSNYNQPPAYNSQYNNGPYNNHGAPRYTGQSWTDHIVLEGGAGVTVPGGETQNYANTGFNILAGAGYKFNNRLSLLGEWTFNRLTVPNSLAAVVAGTPDGNEHIWTIDVNPKFNFIHRGRSDGYVIGGGGFSRALTNFTVPVLFNYYDYYFGPYPCSGTITVAHASTNQGNIDIGLGSEWRMSPYEKGKIFLEARWERLFGPDNGLPPGPDANLIPITVGYRW
jgi:hypothetical protein